jgi:ABC-type polysaccharide/polyol phosphate export permease
MTFVRHYDAATAPRGAFRHLLPIVGYPALVWRNRYMLQNFLRRDLMARAHGSYLGLGWMLLQPLFQFAVYYLIFGLLFGGGRVEGQAGDEFFAFYLFSGVIVFYAILEATNQSCVIIVDNGNLVKKVAFPSEVLLVHVALVSLVIYLVGATVCLVAGMIVGAMHPGWLLLALPLVLVVQFMMTLGVGMFLANINVFIRDVAQLWRIFTMAWMFLSPVFWRPQLMHDQLPQWADVIFLVNPAYPLIQAHRIALGVQDPHLGDFWTNLGASALWAVGLLLLGYSLFMSRKHKFADMI